MWGGFDRVWPESAWHSNCCATPPDPVCPQPRLQHPDQRPTSDARRRPARNARLPPPGPALPPHPPCDGGCPRPSPPDPPPRLVRAASLETQRVAETKTAKSPKVAEQNLATLSPGTLRFGPEFGRNLLSLAIYLGQISAEVDPALARFKQDWSKPAMAWSLPAKSSISVRSRPNVGKIPPKSAKICPSSANVTEVCPNVCAKSAQFWPKP